MPSYNRGEGDYRRGYTAGYNTGYKAGQKALLSGRKLPAHGDWPNPNESLYCSCGAQWHGIYTLAEIIQTHHQGDAHSKISHDEFTAMGFSCRKTARHKCDKGAKPQFSKRDADALSISERP